MKYLKTLVIVALGLINLPLAAQVASPSIDLKEYYKKNNLVITKKLKLLDDGNMHGVSCKGIVWIKNMQFSTGVIEVDLRGKDVFQQSFLGIAFHGVDTTTYDAVYFRPFNFKAQDSVRRIHAVQYVSAPDNHWDKLRKDFNGVYEKGIIPAPEPDEWFHVRIEISSVTVKVFVNKAVVPALVVKKLNSRKIGLVGLWSTNMGVDGDFANLLIKESKID